jgi:hypothetical protein
MTDLGHAYDDNVYDLNAILHPGSVYDHPRDVLADQTLTLAEKRSILASWASDAAAVTSCPALRRVPGQRQPVSIDDILEAPQPSTVVQDRQAANRRVATRRPESQLRHSVDNQKTAATLQSLATGYEAEAKKLSAH